MNSGWSIISGCFNLVENKDTIQTKKQEQKKKNGHIMKILRILSTVRVHAEGVMKTSN